MLRIVVVDSSAESRSVIVGQITAFLASDLPDIEYLPRINVQPLSPEEIKFHACPDILVVGQELVSKDLVELGKIRSILPDTPIIVRMPSQALSLVMIDNLARMGADDTMSTEIEAAEFFRKIIMLVRKRPKQKGGTLILVDSGKGGLGVTSVVAGLAEAMVDSGKSAAILDLDFETQDLSRFLQVKPFVNEPLQLLFDKKHPVTEEFVDQCLLPVWEPEAGLFCMPPAHDCDELYDARSSYSRTMIAILEILDSRFDCIVVDCACARGALLKTLYRVADKVIFLVNNDPAALYASVDKVLKARSMLTPRAELLLVPNSLHKEGLPVAMLKAEFNAATKLSDANWFAGELPISKRAQRWPGSGDTIFSLGGDKLAKAILQVVAQLGLIEAPNNQAPAPKLSHVINSALVQRLTGTSPSQPSEHSMLAIPDLANKMLHDSLSEPEKRRALPAPIATEQTSIDKELAELSNQDLAKRLLGRPRLDSKLDQPLDINKSTLRLVSPEPDQEQPEELFLKATIR